MWSSLNELLFLTNRQHRAYTCRQCVSSQLPLQEPSSPSLLLWACSTTWHQRCPHRTKVECICIRGSCGLKIPGRQEGWLMERRKARWTPDWCFRKWDSRKTPRGHDIRPRVFREQFISHYALHYLIGRATLTYSQQEVKLPHGILPIRPFSGWVSITAVPRWLPSGDKIWLWSLGSCPLIHPATSHHWVWHERWWQQDVRINLPLS